MDKIYVIKTTHLSSDAGRLISENVIAFGSKKAAERYVDERRKSTATDVDYLAKEGVFDQKWMISEVPASDITIDPEEGDRLISNWITETNQNGYVDYICGNCLWKINLDPTTQLGYYYCPKCMAKMRNPNGDAKK